MLMSNIYRCFLLAIMISVVGCSKMLLDSKATNARELKIFEKDNQRIVFIGMTHIAKPNFFQQVNRQVDSLRNAGYTFYKEGVYYEDDTSKQKKDTLRRKFRQLMGLTIGDYSNKDNKSLPKFFTNGDYIMQSDSLIGIQKTDILADLSYNELIKIHENKYGEILLTQCDWDTSIFDNYKCKDGNAYKKNFYVVDIARTDFLFQQITSSTDDKIAIVYGAGHFKWLYPKLIKSGYTYKNEKLNFW